MSISLERIVFWVTLPIKVVITPLVVPVVFIYAVVDYGTSIDPDKRFTSKLIQAFKSYFRFIAT